MLKVELCYQLTSEKESIYSQEIYLDLSRTFLLHAISDSSNHQSISSTHHNLSSALPEKDNYLTWSNVTIDLQFEYKKIQMHKYKLMEIIFTYM